MIAKNCDGVVPSHGSFSSDDKTLLDKAATLAEVTRAQMERLEIHNYVASVFEVVADANRYFAGQEPWALKKTDPERMATVLYTTAETVRRCAILLQPVMPASIARLLDLLAVAEDQRGFDALDTPLVPGTALPAPQGVFPRFVESEASQS